jgi:lysyl-tRNA synthetase class 2
MLHKFNKNFQNKILNNQIKTKTIINSINNFFFASKNNNKNETYKEKNNEKNNENEIGLIKTNKNPELISNEYFNKLKSTDKFIDFKNLKNQYKLLEKSQNFKFSYKLNTTKDNHKDKSNKIKEKEKENLNEIKNESKNENEKDEENSNSQIGKIIKISQDIKLTNKFNITNSFNNFKKIHKENLSTKNPLLDNITENLAGRISSIRQLGKNLNFLTISSNGENFQIVVDSNKIDTLSQEKLTQIKRGFVIGITGNPFLTKTGEISLLATSLEILSICNFFLPDTKRNDKNTLTNHELRYEKRYLDLLANKNNINFFILRAKIINFLRNKLQNEGYLEVETPILSKKAGGALANPFKTYSNTLKSDLFLRIAPELYLKKLIIGGYEKVFEIGKNFRNEDISIRHNPEFTTCEIYHAFKDYEYMIKFTQDFLKELCIFLNEDMNNINDNSNNTYIDKEKSNNNNYNNKTKLEIFLNNNEVNYNNDNNAYDKIEIDFNNEFNKFDVNTELENYFNTNLSNIYDKEIYYKKLENLFEDFINNNNTIREKTIKNTGKGKNLSLKKKIDKLIENIIEPKCIQPSFIINHPLLLSPLAKANEKNPNLAERFEFFVNKVELINAYSELNNAEEQKYRFFEQMNLNKNGEFDDELHPNDEDYIEALSYGMPPTAGWGLGIDRLCMLFLGLRNIKEVILFPMMNSEKNKKI